MGRYKDYRERERPSYRDENPEDDRAPEVQPSDPGRAPASAGAPVDATVKWFNAEKGFGFVGLAEGSAAFLHIRQLEAAGHRSVPEGARVRVRIGQGRKGPEVTEVMAVELGAAALKSAETLPASLPSRVIGQTKESIGTVKLYKAEKGFGFVGQDGGGKDVFIHATTLVRAGLTGLTAGQRVRMQIGQGQKGLEAQSIELLD